MTDSGKPAELVERIARAICLANGENPDEICEDWMKEFSGWRGYVEEARAAIAAMREPTGAMIREGIINIDCQEVLTPAPGPIWQAMIDEALK